MISVLMAAYREEEAVLREAVESILSQTYRDFELIIVADDPQNLPLIEVLEEYAKKDPHVRLSVNEKNQGLAESLNRGLALSKGSYIARMDADDVAEKDRLEKQLVYMIGGGYDLIGGLLSVISDEGGDMYGMHRFPDDPGKVKKALCYGQCIAHPTWLARREVYEALGGYRKMPLCEDYDFTLRAALAGFVISNLNEKVLSYRMTSGSISRSNLYEQYLYMRYITGCYRHKQIAGIEEAGTYVKGCWTEKKAKQYLKANQYFNQALNALGSHRWLAFLKNGFPLLYTSLPYLDKIYRFFRLTLFAEL